jgi:phosphoribosylanthranilate isomerase
MRIKICGITRPEDAILAESAGADAIGLIFSQRSKRVVTMERALEIVNAVGPFLVRVGVFSDAPLEHVLRIAKTLRLGVVQLNGSEDSTYAAEIQESVRVVRALSFQRDLSLKELESYPANAFLLDGPQPGSGEAFDWSEATKFKADSRFILAGGLNPDNVALGIRHLEPYAVDVATGVEKSPGVKDPFKVIDFVREARTAFANR